MNKKGLTLAAVMVAVVIMIIFATTISIAAINISNDAKKNRFASEIAFVQEAVNNYYNKYNEYPVLESISVDLSNVKDIDIVQFSTENNYESKLIILYEINLSKLGELEITYGNSKTEQDVYAVSKETGKVYYLEGVVVRNNTYFTLTDDLKKAINYVDSNQYLVTKDKISFIPSTTNWTNKPISTKLLVPQDYTNVTIVAKKDMTNESVKVSAAQSVDYFNEYMINDIGTSQVEGNYSIIVSYQKEGISYNQTYSITNFDNVSPNLSVSDKVELVSKNEDDTYRYVKIEKQDDTLSGVKSIKYERENIAEEDAVIYFKNNGIELQSDIIEFDDKTKYITIYMEDNAGNYTLVRKSI